jgi:hypothetical protein
VRAEKGPPPEGLSGGFALAVCFAPVKVPSGFVTLQRGGREASLRARNFQAAATAVRHVLFAPVRSVWCVSAEVR